MLDARRPLFGICFGNQILGRALGLGTYKLRFGHRGLNQPVLDRVSGTVRVTSHNHGFAVDAPLDRPTDTPYGPVEVSHVGLNDDVVEGLRCLDVAGVQRPVPPRVGGRSARRRPALPAVRRPDGGRAHDVPKRTDIEHVMVIGSGPIIIGQASEFDYSGTQACRVLKAEGLRVSLVNSNPATIMTDPEVADATYIEPLTPEFVEKVIAKERPDALLATLGGQTALNIAIGLYENGVLEKYGVQLIGADVDAINRGEDRQIFKDIVRSIGADAPRSTVCGTVEEALATAEEVGYPVVIRPSFTMGGLGSGIATDEPMLRRMAAHGLADSPVHTVLIEESVLGWKEFELELMRDRSDNVVVICSIENIDAMGVHTGDSVTVAPAMTLTDREYQQMRDVGIAVLRAVGVDTGGCNIQFAVHPETGRLVVIEMNPRVSRSSALASKATGFPIAKIAAKLAIGYTLDEITNDITGVTPASFEPSLDYVVVKIPRFAFEKFPGADPRLTTTMKSVGEVMSLGRNFAEALGKAMRSTETKAAGFWTGAGRRGHRRGAARPAAHPGRRPALRRRAGARRRRDRRAGRRGQRLRPVVRRPDRPGPRGRRRRPRRAVPHPGAAAPGQAATACPTGRSPRCGRSWPARTASGRCAGGSASGRSTRPSTPAPPSSPPVRPTTTPPTTRRTRCSRARSRRC